MSFRNCFSLLSRLYYHVSCLHGHHNTFSGATFRPRATGWGGLD